MARKFKTYSHCSLSLSALIAPQPKQRQRRPRRVPRALKTSRAVVQPDAEPSDELVRLLIEADTKKGLEDAIGDLSGPEELETLARGMYSATLATSTIRILVRQQVGGLRISTKKRSKRRLDRVTRDVGLFTTASGPRQVTQTGHNVLIGIVDSGFDLSHPMFRDGAGKLRVESLLEQRETTQQSDREFTTVQLQQALDNGDKPGFDADGHGTHVASIAGGSKHQGLEGVAPGAKFLLVKTNFLDTDKAVSWIFLKAARNPCVVNLSLGHHFGAHDGTDAEERLFKTLSGQGKIIVVSAGNERNDSLHIGGRFGINETQTVEFDVFQSEDGNPPEAGLTLWFSDSDDFRFTLVSPSGQQLSVPVSNGGTTHSSSGAAIHLIRGPYPISNLIQVQIQLLFGTTGVLMNQLRKWKLVATCKSAVVGRLDGWFFNSGYGVFRSHPLVETARTIGLPATSPACIAVASHVSKTSWKSDNGNQSDSMSVVGNTSEFSSLGPTRDGREKPEISGPGHFVTAALARDSLMEDFDDRSLDSKRLLTIEGTSMSAPVVTGIVALLLQKANNLTPAKLQSVLASSASKDVQTGQASWTPAFGAGKIDVVKAIAQL